MNAFVWKYLFLLSLPVGSVLHALPAIPEPGLTLYGKVSVVDKPGTNLTISNISWNFTDQSSGGRTVTVFLNNGITTTIHGGETWYVVRIPFASRNVSGLILDPIPADHLELGPSARQIIRTTVTVNGRSGTLIAPANGILSFAGTSTTWEPARTERVDLSISPPNFSSWASGYLGSSNANNRLPTADPDHDGVVNLLEYVLGGDPTQAQGNISPTATSISGAGGGTLIFIYKRKLDANGLTTQVVEHTSNLAASWSPAIPGQGGVTQLHTPLDMQTEQITVTIPYTGPRHFARLNVTP